MRIRIFFSIVTGIVGLGCHPPTAAAATLIYNFGSVLRGSAPASSSTPWLTAEFTDVGPGRVEMTFTASGLTGREGVKNLLLNMNPALNPCLLVFNQINATGSFRDPRIQTGRNGFRADGAGEFDIRFQFGGSGNCRQFGAGDQVTYLVTGVPSLNASSFDFTSLPVCGDGGFFAVSGLSATGHHHRNGSVYPTDGLVPVPEPSVVLLFGSGLALWGIHRSLRRR